MEFFTVFRMTTTRLGSEGAGKSLQYEKIYLKENLL